MASTPSGIASISICNLTRSGRGLPAGHSSVQAPFWKKLQRGLRALGSNGTPADPMTFSRSLSCALGGILSMVMVLVPSDLGLAARTSVPPARLGMPKMCCALPMTSRCSASPPEAFPISRVTVPSAGRFKKASRVTRRNASIRRSANCWSIAADEAPIAELTTA